MGCGGGKLNSINDPLQQQKLAAANIGLGNYQTASSNVPSLQNYFSQNFGQSPTQTLANEDPLSRMAYQQTEEGLTGQGGPYANLTKNLLGSFDAANAQNNQQLQQQLQAQGLSGSGAGMAVEGNQGVQAAMQRALLGSQAGVANLQMADQLGQQLMQQNQLQGFTDPMMALGQIQSLATPPNFQNIDNTYYTPAQSPLPGLLGSIGGTVLGASLGNGGALTNLLNPQNQTQQPSGNGAPSLGTPGIAPSNYYSGSNQQVQSLLNNPQLLQMLLGGGGM